MNFLYNLISEGDCLLAFMSEQQLTPDQVRAKYERAYGTAEQDYSVMTYEYVDGKPNFISWEDSK